MIQHTRIKGLRNCVLLKSSMIRTISFPFKGGVLSFLAILLYLQPSFSLSYPASSNVSGGKETKKIIFPGGGIFFYWQAGAVTYLREKGYPINDPRIHFTGASAGALCATLTACNVDFEDATSLALKKAREEGVWDRPLGLFGIWGNIIDEWLEELLPGNDLDQHEVLLPLVNDGGKLSILATEVPSFQKKKISDFKSKRDLIDANMASVHIPFFLDGKAATQFRLQPYIDGSFLANMDEYRQDSSRSIILDWKSDPLLKDRKLGDAVAVISEEGIWDLLERYVRTFYLCFRQT